MSFLADQLLLLVGLLALIAGGWSAAGWAAPPSVLRGLAAATFVAAAAIVDALLLALPGWGGSPVALAVMAIATGLLLARLALPPPEHRISAALALQAWWAALERPGRLARGALAGALAATLLWLLRHPAIGLDALVDHLALPVRWVQDGRPGSIVVVNPAFSYANWPISHEVLVAWVLGLSHNLVATLLPTPASLLLLLAAVRAGLAEWGVPPRRAWLGALAAATLPILVVQLPGPNNDLPAVAWTACAGALALAAVRRPRLLPAAVVAAGLAIGTKTTTAPLLAVVLLAGAWPLRRCLRPLVLPLGAAVVAAIACGGVWYLRNLLVHGSPLWPLRSLPGGDPVPPALRAISPSFLGHLSATLHGRTGDYARALAGGLLAAIAAIAAPLWRGRRGVPAALVIAASALIWAASPYTGNSQDTLLALGATRYLLPTLVAAIAVLALRTGRDRIGDGALVVVLALNLVRDRALGFPAAPGVLTVLAGAAIGAALTAALGRPSAGHHRALPRPGILLGGAGLALALATLLIPVPGFMAAHAATGQSDAALVRWLQGRRDYRTGTRPVAIAPVALAVLAGPRLAHPLDVVSERATCAQIAARMRAGWLIVERGSQALPYIGWSACLSGIAPVYADGTYAVFATDPGVRG